MNDGDDDMTTQTETAKTNPLHRDITDAEWDAMIGAAPQMLEALKAAYREINWLHREYGGRADTLEVMGRVREAVAEATHQPTPRPRQITGRSALRVGNVDGKEF